MSLYWNVIDRNTGEVFLRGVSVKEAEAHRKKLPQQFKCVLSPDQENPWELPDADNAFQNAERGAHAERSGPQAANVRPDDQAARRLAAKEIRLETMSAVELLCDLVAALNRECLDTKLLPLDVWNTEMSPRIERLQQAIDAVERELDELARHGDHLNSRLVALDDELLKNREFYEASIRAAEAAQQTLWRRINDLESEERCEECGGSGERIVNTDGGDPAFDRAVQCPECGGDHPAAQCDNLG